jgi:creatinine amidohydrolase
MQLLLASWPEVEVYLQTSVGLIIPIGSTEQHGPTGLLGTDAITAEAIARGVGEQTGALVGPTINVGMALHHTDFPGTISLRPSTLLLVVRDYLHSLARAGFQRFFFINGHGGNIATLKAAFAETYSDLAERQIPGATAVRCRLANWFMQRAVMELARELYGSEEGSHATPSEVAVTQFLYPDSIKRTPLTGSPGQGHAIYGPADFRQRYPDGRMGSNPALATPEQGQRFYERAVTSLVEDYQAFLQEA